MLHCAESYRKQLLGSKVLKMQDANIKAHEKLTGQKRKPNTFQAVDTLKDMILSNKLQAGTNHLEAELATLLGMSRTPVREATLILEAQGLVSVMPRHGVRILSISPKDMTEIYQILTELECLSAELAASKNHPIEEFEDAENAIHDMENALSHEDLEAWAVADDKFHSELVRLGGNQRVINIFDMYTDQVKRARMLTLKLRPIPTKSNEDHRKVLEAIKSGQGDVAVKVHKEHRVQAGQMLVDLLEKFGLSNL